MNQTTEVIAIRATPKVKKQWSDLVYALVGRKGKKFRRACDLLESMLNDLRETHKVVIYG